jgi:hypothetical protein
MSIYSLSHARIRLSLLQASSVMFDVTTTVYNDLLELSFNFHDHILCPLSHADDAKTMIVNPT